MESFMWQWSNRAALHHAVTLVTEADQAHSWDFIQESVLAKMSGPDMDANLMVFVNILGVVTFSSIVLYHFITATPKDAEL